MTTDEWANVVASSLAAAACVGFAVTYHVRVYWWHTDVGKNLMALAVAVGLLCVYTVLVGLWPDGDLVVALHWVRTVVVLSIAVVMVQRTLLFVREQRSHRRRP